MDGHTGKMKYKAVKYKLNIAGLWFYNINLWKPFSLDSLFNFLKSFDEQEV